MDKLVYIYYLLLPVLLFYGAKVYKKGEWNEEVMSLSHTKAFLGFAAIMIIFHHCSQRTCARWLPPIVIRHGLDAFVYVGYLFVAAFFFCSGYGMYTSRNKEHFFDKYFIKRILPVLFPAVVVWLTFYVTERVKGIKVYKPVWINVYDYIWYVPAIIYLYIIFYISFKLIKNDKAGMAVLWIGVVIYIVLTALFSPGSWWFNTVHLFAVGVAMARNKDKRLERYKKAYALRIIVLALITIIGFAWAGYHYQIPLTSHLQLDEMTNFIIETVAQMISAYTFAILVLLIGMKVRIGNKLLALLGTFTLEIYLVHPYFVQGFCFAFLNRNVILFKYIESPFLYVLVVVACSIPVAFLLKKINVMTIIRGFLWTII